MTESGPDRTYLSEATLVGGERAQLLAFVNDDRLEIAALLDGLTEEQARRRLVPSGTTLLWLVAHAAAAQQLWLRHFLTGELTRDELLDDDDLAGLSIAEVQALLRSTTEQTREQVTAAPDLDQLSVHDVRRHGHVSLRWILVHLVEEIARHAGHADILREQLDGATGR